MDAITFGIIMVIFLYFWYYNKNREKFELAAKLPGPKGLPFIGIGLELMKIRAYDMIHYFAKLQDEYGHVVRVMIGPECHVLFSDPKDVEKILSNQKFLEKSEEYDFLVGWLGTGLLISSGSKWHSRRKIITPAFHFKILEQFVEVFDKHSAIFVENLEKLRSSSENGVVDIFAPVTLCALDIICEAAMGVEINAQTDSNSSYVKAVKEMSAIVMQRIQNIFLRLDFFFKISNLKRRNDELLKILHGFTDSVILSRRDELMKKNKFDTKAEGDDDDVGAKKKMAFLDILLQSTIEGQPLSNMDIREEVDTFMFEGHDTTSSGIAFCLYNLAKYPEIQQKAFEEVRNVIGDDLSKSATLSDLNSMNYLEMVIKESLRLYPPVAAYGRKLHDNFDINGKIIPRGANIGVFPFSMARNKELWDDPLTFLPERFDIDAPTKHPYLNIPFSAGPRNCIGQRFAMLEMKSTISKVLRHFELTVEPDYKPILIFEIILRPHNGIMLLINKRKY